MYGSPQESRRREMLGFVHLDAVISKDGRPHFARSLAAINEKNLLAFEG